MVEGPMPKARTSENSPSPTFRKQGRERPKLLRPDLPIGLRDALVDEGREVASVPLLDLR